MRLFSILLASALLTGSVLAACEKSGRAPSLTALHTAYVFSYEQHPSPQAYDKSVPRGVKTVYYPSGRMKLKAWLVRPQHPRPQSPAIVYLHGGLALGKGDLADVQAFRNAGYTVMLPALRGENGNPGAYELFVGEVDDALAAGRWLRSQKGVDPSRIYLIGHSIGGGIAFMSSFMDENPYRRIADINGFYPLSDCKQAASDFQAHFDPSKKSECFIRFPDKFLASLKVPFVGYIGEQDGYSQKTGGYFRHKMSKNAQAVFRTVKGDHSGAIHPAILDFINEIAKDNPTTTQLRK